MVSSDNGLSVKSRGQVKPKPTNVPALPDSDNLQLNIPPAEQAAKTSQGQDLQKSDPGYPPRRLLEKLIRVPCWMGRWRGLTLRAWYLLAILSAHQGKADYRKVSLEHLALELRLDVRQVIRLVQKLERAKVLWVGRRGKCNCYRVLWFRNPPAWIFVDPRWVHQLGLNINEAVLFGYVCFRCNHKPESWFSISKAAEALGLHYTTIRSCLAVLAAEVFIKIRPGRESGGRTNRYQLTSFGWLVSWDSEPKRARQKCHLRINTLSERGRSYTNSSQKGGLSSQLNSGFSPDQDQKPYELLVCIGVNRFVAKPVAAQHRRDPESVENMIWNWTGKTEQSRRYWQNRDLPPPRIPLAGYVVGGLNIGIAECHSIKLSSAGREAKTRGKGAPGLAGSGPPTEAELKKLEQYAENVLKPCLGKPPTPQESAKLAEERRLPDKKAGAEFLTAHQAAVCKRDYGYRRLANSGQKVGICLDKAK